MDLAVVQKKSKVDILSFNVKNIFNPPVLDIIAQRGLLDTESVTVNGEKCPKVSIISDTRILAELPPNIEQIIRLDVFSYSVEGSSEYSIFSSMSLRPTTVSGISKVIQKVIKVLLTTPGTDIFNVEMGAGLGTLVAKNYANHGEISSEVITAIKLAENSILESEVRADMPDSDKLGSISILEIIPIEKVGVSISLEIINREGDTGRASVDL